MNEDNKKVEAEKSAFFPYDHLARDNYDMSQSGQLRDVFCLASRMTTCILPVVNFVAKNVKKFEEVATLQLLQEGMPGSTMKS